MTKNRIDLIRSHLRSQHRAVRHSTRGMTRSHKIHHPQATLTHQVRIPNPMRAEQSITEQPRHDTRDVWKVAQWKWGIDKGSPRWKQLFFRYIFLNFLTFSYKIGIPTPKEVVVEFDERERVIRRTFRWWEDEGIFDNPDQADAGCLDEHWGYTNLPHGRLMPSGSGVYGQTIFPRKRDSKKSHQWAKPQSTFVIKDRKQEERQSKQLNEYLAELNRVLDR